MKWKTKEGKILELKDMSVNHLKNARNLLDQNLRQLMCDQASDDQLGGCMSYEIGISDLEIRIKWMDRHIKRRIRS